MDADFVDIPLETDGFPLHAAIWNNNENKIREIIDNGADVNKQNENKHTPFELAVLYQRSVVVLQLLLDAGANLNINADTNDMSLLHHAAIESNANIIQLLVDKGLNVNMQDSENRTPLHYAVNYRNRSALDVLLRSCNINVNTQNKEGKTPLYCELCNYVNPCVYTISKLLEHGSRVDLLDDTDNTAGDLVKNVKNPDIRACIQMKLQLYV